MQRQARPARKKPLGFRFFVRRLTLILALLSMAGLGLGYAYSQNDPASIFMTAPVEKGRFESVVSASGTIEAQVTVYVSSELSGRIAKVLVDYNDVVTVGQSLAELDQESFVARVTEAKAVLKVAVAAAHVQQGAVERARLTIINAGSDQELAESRVAAAQARQDEAEREAERKTKLAATGNVADRDLSQARTARAVGAADLSAALGEVKMKKEAIQIAEADLSIAEANLENAEAVVEQRQAALDQAEFDLKRTVLRSPIDGVIIDRDINPGQTIAVTLEAKTLFIIANNLETMEAHANIDEADVGKLKVGQKARFTVDAYPDRIFSGIVLQIRKAPEVVQNVVTYTAVVSAPNPEHLLIPGLTADLRIVIEDSGDTLKIPNQALRFRPQVDPEVELPGQAVVPAVQGSVATVWVVGKDGRPKPISVQVGQSDGNSTQLLNGPLADGQQLIVGSETAEQGRSRWFGLRLGL